MSVAAFYDAQLTVSSGTLTNANGGTISVLASPSAFAAGRVLNTLLDNQGGE